jgi:hypothetical protein
MSNYPLFYEIPIPFMLALVVKGNFLLMVVLILINFPLSYSFSLVSYTGALEYIPLLIIGGRLLLVCIGDVIICFFFLLCPVYILVFPSLFEMTFGYFGIPASVCKSIYLLKLFLGDSLCYQGTRDRDPLNLPILGS